MSVSHPYNTGNADVCSQTGAHAPPLTPVTRTDVVGQLQSIGRRGFLHASGLTVIERVAHLRNVARTWDGRTAVTSYSGGRTHTRDGEWLDGTWLDFGKWLQFYAPAVVQKGEGCWCSPMTSTNGRCRDQDVAAIHQLALDADGTGDWLALRHLLDASGLAYVVQRSASHRPELPKWHVFLPLALPWSGEKLEWRAIYRACVGWFGAAAELMANLDATPPTLGFDPKTDRLGQVWYLAARRAEQDPVPETVAVDGLALDLESFLVATVGDWAVHTGFKPVRKPKLSVAAPRVRLEADAKPAIAADTPDYLLAIAFQQAGMLGHGLGDGKWAVACPFESEHTGGTRFDTSTVLFAPKRKGDQGKFYCSHGHCEGRLLQDVLRALPSAAISAAMTIQSEAALASRGAR